MAEMPLENFLYFFMLFNRKPRSFSNVTSGYKVETLGHGERAEKLGCLTSILWCKEV